MTDIDSLLLVPLDERPINAAYPRLLAAALGWHLDMPGSSLGSRKVPADSSAVAEWLCAAAGRGAAGAVVSLDTLAWGGLIPSRQSGTDLDAALQHLAVLRRVRSEHPRLPLLAFSSIQRVSREDDDAEEPEYYRQHGRAIFRRSVLEHRSQVLTLAADEAAEMAALRQSLPKAVWADQLAIRQRTLAVNLAALDLVADGVVDTLVLNQDDTTVWGLNVINRARLEREVRVRGLGDRVLIYPGADEVAQVLMARLTAMVHGRRTTVGTLFSSRAGADVQTSYEDRPLGDLVTVHLRAAGAVQAPAAGNADWWLALNSPSRSQGQGGAQYALEHGDQVVGPDERASLESSEEPVRGLDRSLESFRDALGVLLADGGRVSVADVAHVNGADDELLRGLATDGALGRLAGYGGWNTAGNALGSAVALGCAAALGADPVSVELAATARLVDDWLYQARVRSKLLLRPELRPLGLGGFVPDADLSAVEKQARAWLNDELRDFALPYEVTRLALPWKRVFEIDYDLCRVADSSASAASGPARVGSQAGAGARDSGAGRAT